MTKLPGSDSRTLEASMSPVPAAGAASSTPKRFGWLRGRRIAVLAAVALAVAAFAFGSAWFGFAAILPLLYLLPCAAMLYFCQKGMNNPADRPVNNHDEE